MASRQRAQAGHSPSPPPAGPLREPPHAPWAGVWLHIPTVQQRLAGAPLQEPPPPPPSAQAPPILEREARIGPGPPWSPEAPS